MADKNGAAAPDKDATDEKEQTAREAVASALAKADGKEAPDKNDDDEKENEFDESFMGKMSRYMKSEKGKKFMEKYSCKKADDETDETAELLAKAAGEDLDPYREQMAAEGEGEEESGYFIPINADNSLWKALESLNGKVESLIKSNGAVIDMLTVHAELQKATARLIHDESLAREELAKAGELPDRVRGAVQGGDMAPSTTALSGVVDVDATCERLAKAVEDDKLPMDQAMRLTHMLKVYGGAVSAMPDDIQKSLSGYIKNEEAA